MKQNQGKNFIIIFTSFIYLTYCILIYRRRILVDQKAIVQKYDEIMAEKEELEQKAKRKKNRLLR